MVDLCTDCEKDYPPADCHLDAARIRVLQHELDEVRRVFEKHGMADLLVSADGSISHSLGVMRLAQKCASR